MDEFLEFDLEELAMLREENLRLRELLERNGIGVDLDSIPEEVTDYMWEMGY